MNRLRTRTRTAVLLGAVIVALPVFSPMLRAKREPAAHTGATIPQLEKDVPELMKKNSVPGLSMALIRGGKRRGCTVSGRKKQKQTSQ